MEAFRAHTSQAPLMERTKELFAIMGITSFILWRRVRRRDRRRWDRTCLRDFSWLGCAVNLWCRCGDWVVIGWMLVRR